jgi:hypothetical protein
MTPQPTQAVPRSRIVVPSRQHSAGPVRGVASSSFPGMFTARSQRRQKWTFSGRARIENANKNRFTSGNAEGASARTIVSVESGSNPLVGGGQPRLP